MVLALLKARAAKAVIPNPSKKIIIPNHDGKVELELIGKIFTLIHIKKPVSITRIGGGILSSRMFIITNFI